jgi:hypothetical protein
MQVVANATIGASFDLLDMQILTRKVVVAPAMNAALGQVKPA